MYNHLLAILPTYYELWLLKLETCPQISSIGIHQLHNSESVNQTSLTFVSPKYGFENVLLAFMNFRCFKPRNISNDKT